MIRDDTKPQVDPLTVKLEPHQEERVKYYMEFQGMDRSMAVEQTLADAHNN